MYTSETSREDPVGLSLLSLVMDPLSIIAAAGSLAATIFTLVKSIGSFVPTAQNSRTNLDAVSRELISLQVCLEVLETDLRHGAIFGHELEVSPSGPCQYRDVLWPNRGYVGKTRDTSIWSPCQMSCATKRSNERTSIVA